MTTQEMPPALLAEMRALSQPIWDDFVTRVPEAGPLLTAFLAAVGKPS